MKVLIPVLESKLHPIGGPYGYLYNLKLGIEEISETSIKIDFIKDVSKERTFTTKIKKNKEKLYKPYIILKILCAKYRKERTGYDGYDIVHFHSSLDMWLNQNKIKKSKATIVLTSHSPSVWYKEFIDNFNIRSKCIKGLAEKIDQYAFERANYIVFPCREAEEPYYNNWEYYTKFKLTNEYKYKYLLSGIKKCNYKIERKDIREKYGIPKAAKVLCYVGRHNKYKGYDLLKKAFDEKLKEKGYYVIVAGKEEPMKGIEDEKWIEVGWTDDPYSIVNSADLFILPNRETYFDLVVLEVLSLGKCILMSETGGNNFFKKTLSAGIFYFKKENALSLSNAVESFFGNPRHWIDGEKENEKLFQSFFNEKIFAQNYIKLMEEILYENRK